MSQRLSLIEIEHLIDGQQFVASDFDGTQGCTFEGDDGIIDVAEAYRLGVDELFGHEALSEYVQEGEHRNRTPSQIVEDLNPGIGHEELETLTEVLVDFKLDILLDQVGKLLPDGARWPRPVAGFIEFCEGVERFNAREKRITTAVLSAGHTLFIEKTYDMWGVDLPDFMITEDTLNDLGLGLLPPAHKAKPAPLMMSLAKAQWLAGQGITINNYNEETATLIDSRIIYVGDDDEKDRALAIASNVGFVLIESGSSSEAWQHVASWSGAENTSPQEVGAHVS